MPTKLRRLYHVLATYEGGPGFRFARAFTLWLALFVFLFDLIYLFVLPLVIPRATGG